MKPSSSDATASNNGLWVAVPYLIIGLMIIVGPAWGGHWDPILSLRIGRGFLIASGLSALAGFLVLGRNLTPHPKPREGAKLVREGIYRFIRHPLYCSLILGSVGWGLFCQSIPVLCLALLLGFMLDAKSRVEEQWLRERFPEYSDYQHRVRRFIPWIY